MQTVKLTATTIIAVITATTNCNTMIASNNYDTPDVSVMIRNTLSNFSKTIELVTNKLNESYERYIKQIPVDDTCITKENL